MPRGGIQIKTIFGGAIKREMRWGIAGRTGFLSLALLTNFFFLPFLFWESDAGVSEFDARSFARCSITYYRFATRALDPMGFPTWAGIQWNHNCIYDHKIYDSVVYYSVIYAKFGSWCTEIH